MIGFWYGCKANNQPKNKRSFLATWVSVRTVSPSGPMVGEFVVNRCFMTQRECLLSVIEQTCYDGTVYSIVVR